MHEIIVCLFISAMASEALLLNRFIYPRLFWYLPTWQSTYWAAGVLFIALFFSLLMS
ncbi:hypothetical protein DSM25558_4275 [Agrobacterium sp. DSM 25558]|nr:hypothetical protein DSM25558_4275 [Agrobacterium sp. DSM 25558]